MTIETEHTQELDLSLDTFWREIGLNLDYQERLYREALGCTRMEVVQHEGGFESGVKRRLRFEKPIDAPAPIRKIFGSTVTIEEVGEFDPKAQTWSFRIVPAIMADHIDIRGAITVSKRNGHIAQISRNSVSCNIFGLSKIIEHFVAKSTREGQADKAAFTRKYIAERALR